MESWREVWRDGFAKVLPRAGLEALAQALETDSPKLIQGATTSPPPLAACQDWPVDACCAVSLAAGVGLETVGEYEEQFARACFDADAALGQPGACRWFLNFFDDTPRDEMRRELLPEVRRALAE